MKKNKESRMVNGPFRLYFRGAASTPDWYIVDSQGCEVCTFGPTTTRSAAGVAKKVKSTVARLNDAGFVGPVPDLHQYITPGVFYQLRT